MSVGEHVSERLLAQALYTSEGKSTPGDDLLFDAIEGMGKWEPFGVNLLFQGGLMHENPNGVMVLEVPTEFLLDGVLRPLPGGSATPRRLARTLWLSASPSRKLRGARPLRRHLLLCCQLVLRRPDPRLRQARSPQTLWQAVKDIYVYPLDRRLRDILTALLPDPSPTQHTQ